MSRRRTIPAKPLDHAFPLVDKLEQAAVQSMLDVRLTPEQVVRWLYPDHIVDKLKAAFPYVRGVDRGSNIGERMTLPVVFPATVCQFYVSATAVKMLVPEAGLAEGAHADRGEPILAATRQAYEQHLRFEKVRQVLTWLNANATVGAMRNYCPWLSSLMPADHDFHKAGTMYREPTARMDTITPVMRECSAIMAQALLLGEPAPAPKDRLVAVAFQGVRETMVGSVMGRDTYTSQAFNLT